MKLVFDLFWEQVQNAPKRIALIDDGPAASLTYGELGDLSLRVANRLLKSGVTKGDIVTIEMPRVKEYVAAMLGCWRVGVGFAPLDSAYPEARRRYVKEDCAALAVIDTDFIDAARNDEPYYGELRADLSDTAIIIYTSGSTGKPKGVVHDQQSLIASCLRIKKTVGVSSTDIYGMMSVFTFVTVLSAIPVPLCSGSTIRLIPDAVRRDMRALADFLYENNIAVTFFSPKMLSHFASRGGALKKILTGSERVSGVYFDDIQIINLYGLTETAASVMAFKLDKAYANTPIGKPLDGISVYLMDEEGNLADEGEICVAGHIAKGYLNLPEQTAQAFVDNPFKDIDGHAVLFKTGDIGQRLPDGNIVYINRKDWMVKINGQRVEPGEVEAALRALPEVAEAAVKGFVNEYGQTYLCAYYTERSPAAPEYLRSALAQTLAPYMLPSFYIRLDALPINPNGKLDRMALPTPSASAFKAAYIAPESEAQKLLCAGFEAVLKVSNVGIDDDFFALGGDSIKTVLLSEHCAKLNLSSMDVLAGRTPRKIAERIGGARIVSFDGLDKDARDAPLTDSQMGVYLECVQNPSSLMYNLPFAYRFSRSDIEPEKLISAIQAVIRAHAAFSLRIEAEDGEPRMVFMTETHTSIPVTEADVADIQRIKRAFVKPFDLANGPLYRFELALTASSCYLLFDMHHIVCDGASVGVIERALTRAYSGGIPAPERVSPIMLSQFERQNPASAQSCEYFEKRLAGVEVDSNLLPDVISDVRENSGDRLEHTLDLDIMRTEQFVRSSGITEGTLFLAAFAYALSKFTGQEESLFCTVNNGRHSAELNDTVGMLVRTLPIYCKIDEESNVADFLKSVQTDFFETMAHDDCSFGELAREYGLRSDVMFVYQAETLNGFTIGGTPAALDAIPTGDVQANLVLMVLKRETGYIVALEYRADLYTRDTIRRFAEGYAAVLTGFMDKDRLCNVTFISASDIRMMDGFNDTDVPFDENTSMVELLRGQARKTPDNIAIVYLDKRYTYREYDALTDNIAARLREMGVGRGDNVPVLIPRCEYMPIAAIGVLKSGAAYQPLDPSYPSERLNFMVKDAAAKLLIADRNLRGLLSDYSGDVLFTDEFERLPNAAAPVDLTRGNDALVLLYTSGTTGTPKGCILEHRNIISFCRAYNKAVKLSAASRLASYANFGFDANVQEIFATLLCGASLYILEESLRIELDAMDQYFTENGITTAFMTTQVGRQFAVMSRCPTLTHLTVGGEKLTPFVPRPGLTVYNGYGPSECFAYVCVYLVQGDRPPLIGKPNDNTKLYVVDKRDRMLPIGVPGELLIAGEQAGRGYLNRPEVTEKVFVKNPFSNDPKYARVYRTGDFVRWLPDGNLEFIGRRDEQVKIRGFRIELTEVERVIRDFPGIQDAIVVAKDAPAGGKMLVAYAVSDQPIDAEALNAFILAEKPPYMIPAVTMQIERIPLNANGKVDKRKLPEPTFSQTDENALSRAETNLEKSISEVLEGVLGHRDFSVTTDLQMAGLNSISAIKLAAKLNERFSFSPSVKALVNGASVLSIENEMIEHLLAYKDEPPQAQSARLASYPLTQTQLGIYFEYMLDTESDKYNIPLLFRLSKDTDIDCLERAIHAAIEAHPFIKCKIIADDESGALMIPQDDLKWEIERFNVDALDMDAAAKVTFHLDDPPIFAIRLYETETELLLAMVFHHILMDGTSIAVLLDDIQTAYAGGAPKSETYTSFDLALDEQAARQSPAYERAKAYYDNMFAGVNVRSLPERDVFSDVPRASHIRKKLFSLNAEAADEFCNKHGFTPTAMFTAAFAYALGKLSGEENALFAAVYNGRTDPRALDIMGMLVKTYPIYMPLDDMRGVPEFISDMSVRIRELTTNDLYSFAEASRAYSITSDILFAYQGEVFDSFIVAGQRVKPEAFSFEDAKAPLSVDISRENDSFIIDVEYRADYYSEAFISCLIDVYDMIAGGMLRAQALGDIALAYEKALDFIERINDTDYPVEYRPAHALLEESAARYPDRIAVIASGERFTYSELNARANRLAHALIKRGAEPGAIVALMLPRDARVYITRQGILKSGAAFLPIDPTYPDERVTFMLSDSGASRLIVTPELANERAALLASLPCAVDVFGELLAEENKENPNVCVEPDELCYCIYTSGSMGTPKGVMLTQRNLVNFVDDNPKNPEILGYIRRAKVSLALAAITFDVSVMEEFIPLAHGMTICMANDDEIHDPAALARLMEENHVDMMSCTPSYLSNLIDLNVMRSPLERVASYDFGAEAFPPSLFDIIRNINPNACIMNGYGPTEATISCTMAEVTDPRSITIGRPAANVKAYIVDNEMRILPPCVSGELLICGAGVGRGYIGREELTREKFITLNGLRAYRTGDIARYTASGQIMFRGRFDNQVKLRGLRVELGEIENAINACPNVLMSCVRVYGEGMEAFLAAYYTASIPVDAQDIRAQIAKTLTPYMVPSVVIQLDAFPLTANGKIDVKKLPEPDYEALKRAYVAPENDVEREFCALFESILKLDKVGATDDFFELGGTSLTASRVAMFAMEKGYPIVYADVFRLKTPRALARIAMGSRVPDGESDDISAYDYTPIDRALSGNVSARLSDIRKGSVGNILLTGATGFLGIHVLWDYLRSEPGVAYCLVRPGKAESLQSRLQAMLVYYFSDSFDSYFDEGRIVCVEGDITDDASLMRLDELPFDTLINCAACVKHFAADDILERVNVDGVKNLIALCERTRRRLIQVSTVSVAGEGVNGAPPADERIYENILFFGQALDNAYLLSKFKAERIVLSAISRGLDAKIIRVGNLMARYPDGEFQINFMTNGFMRQLRAYKLVGAFPISLMNVPLEFSEIDFTAAAILRLASTDASFTVFHAYNNHVVTFADVISVLRDYGFAIDYVSDEEFQSRLSAAMENPALSDAMSGLIAYMTGDVAQQRYLLGSECSFTTQALFRLSFKWPVTSEEYVTRMVKALDGLGMFNHSL